MRAVAQRGDAGMALAGVQAQADVGDAFGGRPEQLGGVVAVQFPACSRVGAQGGHALGGAGGPQPLQGQLVFAGLVGGHVHVQVGDHQGVKQVGPALDRHQAGHRAHGFGQHDHLVGAQVLAQELDDLDGVGDPPVEGHRAAAGLAVAAQGLARPAVVPLDDGEVLLPGSQGR